MLDLVRIYLFAFGIITFAGGVVGFLKAKSTASLIAGALFGLALVIAGRWIGTGSTSYGLIQGFIVSLALALRFGNAFRRTKKVMPAGIIAVLGIGGAVLTVIPFLQR